MSIAAAAAAEVMEIYGQPFSVDFKGPNDPVTAADRRANALICERLRKAFPGVPIVAEESPAEEWSDYQSAERVFFVDPVDGTREFVARTGQFAVMIGLLEGQEPTHGVLHAPSQERIWAGCVGHGALSKSKGGAESQLGSLKDVALSAAKIVSSRSHPTELNREALRLLAPGEVIPMGSAGLKVAAVSDGSADIYLAPEFAGCLWDSCAPEALLRSVGGVVTDVTGQPLKYRATRVENDRGAVAAAPRLHQEVIDRLRDLVSRSELD